MATYTPNLNLGKPEATDAFGNFRQLFNDNMDILDNGGGGGSGGGGNVYGAFIDTNRLLVSETTFRGSMSYTATEDCFVVFYIVPTVNDTTRIKIDGKDVSDWWRGTLITDTALIPVKKGQILSVTNANTSYDSSYFVYGVTQGTSGIFTPIIYSDNERVVGVWRDNKPLYQRTWDLGSDVLINSNTWTNTSIAVADVNFEKIVGSQGTNSGGTTFGFIGANRDQTYVQILQTRNSAISIRYLTLLYTKTTDVAGSGAWNTGGVPTVHYSTSEQVIGTWENGKPLYQQTVIFDTGNVASNIDFNISAYMPVNSVVRHTSFTLDFTFNGDTYHGGNWGGAYVEINGVSYLSFNIGSAVCNKHVELTIQYTKTTD